MFSDKHWLWFVGAFFITLSTSAQTSSTNPPRLHTVADSDHADANYLNFSGIGLGDPAQLSLELVHTRSTDDDLTTALSAASFRIFPWLTLGGGYRFGAEQAMPKWVLTTTLSNSETWSFGYRQRKQLNLVEHDLALMFRPVHWLSAGWVVQNTSDTIDKPHHQVGLSVRPGSGNHRFSSAVNVDSKGELTAWQTGWFGHLWARIEAGVSYQRDEQNSVSTFIFALRTLGPTSIGFGSGIQPGAKDGAVVSSASLKTFSRATTERRFKRRLKVAKIDLDQTNEYRVSGWWQRTVDAPFFRVLQQLDRVARRDDIDAVLLTSSGFSAGWAQTEELRYQVNKIKAAGKRVFAFVPYGDLRTFSLMAQADEIISVPTGSLDLSGVAGRTLHIKGLLEKLGIEAEFVTTGAYKTAPQMFTHDADTNEAAEMQNEMIQALYVDASQAISSGRNQPKSVVDSWIKKALFTGRQLKQEGLVQHQVHLDAIDALIRKQLGGKFSLVHANKLKPSHSDRWGPKKKIAIIYAVGNLVDGHTDESLFSSGEMTGADSFRQAVRHVALNPDFAGAVVRINSPGGTVSASDAMWRVLRKLSKKKPVVVSLGNVAASGGYYTAVGGSKILANSTTITGSIGVFAGKANVSGLLSKYGITTQLYKRGDAADMLSLYQPWTALQRQLVQKSIDEYAKLFYTRVGTGRSMPLKVVEENAAGRVFVGHEALKRKLVDQIGGLADAILDLKKQAGLSVDLEGVDIFPKPSDSGGNFVNNLAFWSRSSPANQLLETVTQGPFSKRTMAYLMMLANAHHFAVAPYAASPL